MKETPKAARAFYEYCLLEDRSLAKLAQKWGKSGAYVGQLERWSSAHHWVERVATYDKEQMEQRRKEKYEQIRLMNERHAQIGTSLQLKGLKQADDLLKMGKVDASEAIRMIKLGTDLERLARGVPTEHTEQTVNTTGIAVYLPQKKTMEGGDANVSSDS